MACCRMPLSADLVKLIEKELEFKVVHILVGYEPQTWRIKVRSRMSLSH